MIIQTLCVEAFEYYSKKRDILKKSFCINNEYKDCDSHCLFNKCLFKKILKSYF